MTRVTCRLTAKNRDQLRNPTLGNRKWATFAFLGRSNKLAYLSLRMGTRGTPLQFAVELKACAVSVENMSFSAESSRRSSVRSLSVVVNSSSICFVVAHVPVQWRS